MRTTPSTTSTKSSETTQTTVCSKRVEDVLNTCTMMHVPLKRAFDWDLNGQMHASIVLNKTRIYSENNYAPSDPS